VFHEPCAGLSADGCEFLLDLVWYSETGGIELGRNVNGKKRMTFFTTSENSSM
jgi:hypothetical protein